MENKGDTIQFNVPRDVKTAEDVLMTAYSAMREKGYDPVYGARPLKRYIQKHVETLSAKLILQDLVDEGDTILIDVKNGALDASVVKGEVRRIQRIVRILRI